MNIKCTDCYEDGFHPKFSSLAEKLCSLAPIFVDVELEEKCLIRAPRLDNAR